MNVDKQIAPFKIIRLEESTSVILNVGEYRNEIFAEREEEGFEGNGYDWESLAVVFLNEKMPELKQKIRFDPEASMFCAYSKDEQALEKFAVAFHSMCEDTEQMRDLFSRAELD